MLNSKMIKIYRKMIELGNPACYNKIYRLGEHRFIKTHEDLIRGLDELAYYYRGLKFVEYFKEFGTGKTKYITYDNAYEFGCKNRNCDNEFFKFSVEANLQATYLIWCIENHGIEYSVQHMMDSEERLSQIYNDYFASRKIVQKYFKQIIKEAYPSYYEAIYSNIHPDRVIKIPRVKSIKNHEVLPRKPKKTVIPSNIHSHVATEDTTTYKKPNIPVKTKTKKPKKKYLICKDKHYDNIYHAFTKQIYDAYNEYRINMEEE